MLISNCQFLYADFSIGLILLVSNCIVTHCDFNIWGGTNVYTGQVNPFPTNTPNTVGYNGSVGIFCSGTPDFNVVVVDNNYNGNTNLVPSANNPFGYVNTSESDGFGPDGFVNFQSGGNYFIARNHILNNRLEGVQLSAGPSAIVGNTFYTLYNDASCCAFALNAIGFASALGNNVTNRSTCVIGNVVYGGRNGYSSQGEASVPLYARKLLRQLPDPLPELPGVVSRCVGQPG